MTAPQPRSSAHAAVLVRLGLSLAACGLVAALSYRAGVAELGRRAGDVETRLSEKLAQHDAHLTSLAAVVRMADTEPSPVVAGLADSIAAFYPRITEIATVTAQNGAGRVLIYAPAGAAPQTLELSTLPPLDKPGSAASLPLADGYEIIKLVTSGRYLRLHIDARQLVADDLLPPDYGYALRLGDSLLAERAAQSGALALAQVDLAVNNASQPLKLAVSRGFGLADLLPPAIIIPILAALALAVWLWRQYRAAVLARREEALRAAMLEQEARLAHAGRVNALGEMASGIAHELAQPVAALLSQSQAARRALTLDRSDLIEQALDANVAQAKRAGDILARMRAYIAGGAAQLESIDLRAAVTDALRLIEPDLTRRGVTLETRFAPRSCRARIDVVSFQQVIHNLLLNAADALAGRVDLRITINVGQRDGQAVVTIADNGPGIAPEALPRLFEPFYTTKPDGMGLGLPLCARLMEKMDGQIEAGNDSGAVFTLRLPSEAKP